MERIKKVEELKSLLETKGYKEDEIVEFLSMMKPFYDFYDFMLETHKMDYIAVEEDSANFSEKVFTEYLEKIQKSDSPLKYMLGISGDIFKRYATKYDYSEPEKVKIALTKYMELIMKNDMKNGHK